MLLPEEVTVPRAALPGTLADLSILVRNLAASPVESGLCPEPITVRPGHLTARMRLTERSRSRSGSVDPFALGLFADFGVGVAVNSALTGGHGGPTVELTFALAADPDPAASFLLLESELVTLNGASGVGRAAIRDDTGVTVAHAFGVMATSAGPDSQEAEEPATLRFDPRSVILEPLSADRERARVRLDETMVNVRGSLHGGVLTGIAMVAQDAFCATSARPGLSFAVQFLRPAAPQLGHLECHSEFVRRGRSFRTVRTRLMRPDGTVLVEATGTSTVSDAVVS